MKRLFDFVVAALGLLILSPVLLVILVLVRVDSPGPSLFRQIRVGLHGRPFKVLKFRTMVTRATDSNLKITVAADSRITRLGSVLRKYKLDELPQLINVLRGDMSLVGPRPEVPEYVAHYPEDARRTVLSVRPGITDDASIEFRNENDLLAQVNDPETYYLETILPRKLALYERYVASRSFFGDLAVILRTLRSVVMG